MFPAASFAIREAASLRNSSYTRGNNSSAALRSPCWIASITRVASLTPRKLGPLVASYQKICRFETASSSDIFKASSCLRRGRAEQTRVKYEEKKWCTHQELNLKPSDP